MYNWLTYGIESAHNAAMQDLCCNAPFLFLYKLKRQIVPLTHLEIDYEQENKI